MSPQSLDAYFLNQYASALALCLQILLVINAVSVYSLAGYIVQSKVRWPKEVGLRHRFILGAFWPLLVVGYLAMLPRLRAQQAEARLETQKNKHSFLNWKAV